MAEKNLPPSDPAAPAPTDMLEVFQQRAAALYPAISPTDITTWLQIAQAVVEAIQNCKKSGSTHVASMIKQPGMLARVALRKRLQATLGAPVFKQHGDHLNRVLFEVGREASPNELTSLCQQVLGG